MTTQLDGKRIGVFLAIALGWSAVFGGVLIYLVQNDLIQTGLFQLYLVVLIMPSPAVAHILTRLITKEGWENLYLKPRIKQSWPWWVVAWLGTPLLIAVGVVLFFLIMPQYYDPTFPALQELIEVQAEAAGIDIAEAMPDGVDGLRTLLIAQFGFAVVAAPILNAIPVLGEEFGWRAYLLPKLMPLGPRLALIIHGAIWGLWHAPIISIGWNYGTEYAGFPWVGIGMMTLAGIWLGVFHGWLQLKSGTVWPAVIAHGSLNGIARGTPYLAMVGVPLLLGPTAVALIGGLGFTLAAVLILTVPGALDEPRVVDPTQMEPAPAAGR